MIDRTRRSFLLAGATAPIWFAGTRLDAADKPPLDVRPTTVASGLRHPWSVAFLPAGDFLVAEKDGWLVRVRPDGALNPVGGTPPDLDNVRTDPRDNSGLFDIALSPDFAQTGRLFLAYASKGEGGGATRLIEGRLADDKLEDQRVLFDATPRTPDRFHYGGALLVAGGHLFLSTGERHYNERDNPPLPAAQDPRDRRGKIYRFTLQSELAPPAESAPYDWYACGIRATQGMAARPGTDEIWFTDHGSVGGDEINLLRPGGNYGWPARTAGGYRNSDCRPIKTLEGATYLEPSYVWSNQTVAPTGLTFYDGRDFPEWRGDLLVAGLSRGNLVRVKIAGAKAVAAAALMREAPVRLRNVKVSPDGGLFAVTDERNGRLLRFDRNDR